MKQTSFEGFLRLHAEDLAHLDLSGQALRRCIKIRIAYDQMPVGVRDQLSYSVLLLLAQVDEPNQRARLAMEALRLHWTVAQLREALAQSDKGRFFDTDANEPGVQPPGPAPMPARRPQPSRLVARTVKWADEIDAWQADVAQIDVAKLSAAQREKVAASVAAVRERLDKIAELFV